MSLVFMSSSAPRRDGNALKNQICTIGAARLMCPMRLRRTRLCVTFTWQRSQMIPLYFVPLYFPHEHSQSLSGPKMRSQKSPSFSARYVRELIVSGFFTSPNDHERISFV